MHIPRLIVLTLTTSALTTALPTSSKVLSSLPLPPPIPLSHLARTRFLFDSFKEAAGAVGNAFEVFGQQVKDAANCIGATGFDKCAVDFKTCADQSVSPDDCQAGRTCLEKAGVATGDCFD
ncbi:hypothetical protein K469DRAFT_305633 [Zopfia rhizophila CBS 207.26]|uniref:Extracellular membrane protein CFEM domain-containing protein n=1 Tax=Zopfia rhizophila CBS 207.26 TaxID=1314779 RepID=A0A6A6EQB5_9PEZI|nr:hypothetical protein K469DRAFT_305633 [Zopfia rhizophila CBS 207.26]